MPPKKKGKGKGKKGAKKGKEELPQAPEPPLSESSKEYYLVQIRDLETRVTRYQKKCDNLQLLYEDMEERYNQLVQDRKDIVDFLKKSLEERQEDIASLQDRLVGQQQVKDAEKENFEGKINDMQDDYQALTDQMTSEITILKGKLDALEEFRIQREELMQNFAHLKAAFEEQEKNHAEMIYDLERKAVVDRDRMKKEMAVHLNAVAEEFRNLSDQQTADTVKRNIRENVAINVQLTKMTETVKELLQENEDLRHQNKEKKIQIDILESTHNQLAKKNNVITKVLKLLALKTQEQRLRLQELESKDMEYEQVGDHFEDTKKENKAMKAQVISLEKELKETGDMLEQTKKENNEINSSSERLEDILTSTAHTLKNVLTEKPEEDEVDVAIKRSTMIERLLLVLDAAALLGKAPPPKDFFDKRNKALMAPLAAIPRRRKQDISIMDRYREYPHYKLGDLGLIPRPRQKIDRRALSLSSSGNYMAKAMRGNTKQRPATTDASKSPVAKPDKLPPIG